MKSEDDLPIARIGKSVGLHGKMRLNLLTDFPEQFKKGATFKSDRGVLTIADYDKDRGTVRFEGVDNVDDAKRLTNAYLYTTKEAGEAACNLGENEYFWYQIIGLLVFDKTENEPLGRVSDIQRLADTDYLVVRSASHWVERGSAESFLVPYIDRYIDRVDLSEGKIYTRDTKELMDAS
ncbi:ribosome maturation factor RimM [Hydrogenimonas sp.]